MIRNVLVAPAAVIVRALVRAALTLVGAISVWAPAGFRRAALGAAGTLLEAGAEYPLYLLGWLGWGADWLFRGPALWICRRGGMPRGELIARANLLLPRGSDPREPVLRVRAMFDEAAALLRSQGIALSLDQIAVLSAPPYRLPRCGVAGLFSRFFSWASSRGGTSPRLTVYVVPGFAPLAGCSFPGADWVVVDLGTDGTTVVHEIGHLADLWPHHPDPDNFMTARPGGTHDRVTQGQRAMLRTCRFVGRGLEAEPATGGTGMTRGTKG